MTEQRGIFERPTEELTPAEVTARGEAVLDTVMEAWKDKGFLRESVEVHDGGWVHVLSTEGEFSGGGVGTTIATAEHESAHMVSTVVVRGGMPIPVMLQATARQFPAEGVRHTEMDRGAMERTQQLLGQPEGVAIVRIRRDKEALGAEANDPIPYAIGITAQGSVVVLVRSGSQKWQRLEGGHIVIQYPGSGILQIRLVSAEDLDGVARAAQKLIARENGEGSLSGGQVLAEYGLGERLGDKMPNVSIVDIRLSPPSEKLHLDVNEDV